MLLETRQVSRKTPLDGKLEISAATASRLATLGAEFTLVGAGRTGTARLQAMACTCAKGASASHVHHFVESQVLRDLTPGSEVGVELEERAVRIG